MRNEGPLWVACAFLTLVVLAMVLFSSNPRGEARTAMGVYCAAYVQWAAGGGHADPATMDTCVAYASYMNEMNNSDGAR